MTHPAAPQEAPADTPPHPSLRLRVPFRDVDMHGHVHNAVFLSYFEAAINDFLRETGLAPHFSPKGGSHLYFVRKAEATYDAPARFEDLLEISVEIARIGRTSLVFRGAVAREGESSPCATVEIVWVCVDAASRRPDEIPAPTRSALEAIASRGGGN
jgi:acyl-CoA thioester hydrolase